MLYAFDMLLIYNVMVACFLPLLYLMISEARQEGITILCGGVKPSSSHLDKSLNQGLDLDLDPSLANGYFVPPTVMVDVPITR